MGRTEVAMANEATAAREVKRRRVPTGVDLVCFLVFIPVFRWFAASFVNALEPWSA